MIQDAGYRRSQQEFTGEHFGTALCAAWVTFLRVVVTWRYQYPGGVGVGNQMLAGIALLCTMCW
jgi:hypothetical protein